MRAIVRVIMAKLACRVGASILMQFDPIDVSAELTRAALPWAYNLMDEFVGSHTPNEREAFLDMASRLPRLRFVAWPYPRTEMIR